MPLKAAIRRKTAALPVRREEDPELYSDGLPMAQNDYEHRTICHAAEALRGHFRDRADMHVRGDMFIYYEPWPKIKRVVQDVLVVRGVKESSRNSYKLWDVGKPPDFVLEIASASPEKRDGVNKPKICAGLGVREFWRFDPPGATFRAPLAGRQLRGERLGPQGYEPPPPNGPCSIRSAVLGLDVRGRGGELRFWDPAGRKHLRTLEESQRDRRAAELELDDERQGRIALEAENAELRARLEALDAPGQQPDRP